MPQFTKVTASNLNDYLEQPRFDHLNSLLSDDSASEVIGTFKHHLAERNLVLSPGIANHWLRKYTKIMERDYAKSSQNALIEFSGALANAMVANASYKKGDKSQRLYITMRNNKAVISAVKCPKPWSC